MSANHNTEPLDGTFGPDLLPQHVRMLVDSAISPEVARARGYKSIREVEDLAALGFASHQRSVPGLLIPSFNVRGEASTPDYRPDAPRVNKDAKAVKYERPKGSQLSLDVPQAVRSQLGDPSKALYITEGIRKADAAVSAGLLCIA